MLAGDLSVAVHRGSGITEALGLRAAAESATTITTRAIATVYTELDFTLGQGALLWSASPRGEPSGIIQRSDEAPVSIVPAALPLRISA